MAYNRRPVPQDLGKPRDTRGRPWPTAMTVQSGPGLTAAAYNHQWIRRDGNIIYTEISMDITGLAAAAAGDIIGAAAGGAAYLCRISTAENGIITGGEWYWTEAPVGGDTDIDLHVATAATAAYNDAASGVAGNAQAINTGTISLGTRGQVIADVISDAEYLYLVSVGSTAAAYTAGRFLLTLIGRAA